MGGRPFRTILYFFPSEGMDLGKRKMWRKETQYLEQILHAQTQPCTRVWSPH